jgi:hypothetical protein
MLDPILSLAMSVQGNRGVYALLLGSGVSRSSGVPTGWGIVQDLIRKLAHIQNESCEPGPVAWYRARFGKAPDYSELLNETAKTSAERMQLLRSYFEPTDQEREEGRKLPTQAHRAIAGLVAKGYVKVLVTTNFDRLFELALADLGIQPFVISTPDAAKGALPLVHSRCTVIKLNGDYLDCRLKNTGEELAHYENTVEHLLDQVFDEFGLIVCGWSGEWDNALRTALQRCANRRFTTYWATKSKLSQKAKDLSALRQATVVEIAGADEFFAELSEKVLALEEYSDKDVLSAKIAVSRLKKYLSDHSQRIHLHDLLTTETEKAYNAVRGSKFSLTGSGLSWSSADIPVRLRSYESELETVLHLMICGAHWGEPEHDTILLKIFKRLADQTGPQGGLIVWIRLQLYPALLLLYGMGLAAISRSNYRFLRSLFALKIRQDDYKPEGTVAGVIYDQSVLERQHQNEALTKTHTPLSDHLFTVLRDPLREYLPSDGEYHRTFDWFEYLLCLCHCDAETTCAALAEDKAKNPDFLLWASVGRFAWKTTPGGSPNILEETEVRDGEPYSEKVAAVIEAGFFESEGKRDDKYREVKAAFDRAVAEIRTQWRFR